MFFNVSDETGRNLGSLINPTLKVDMIISGVEEAKNCFRFDASILTKHILPTLIKYNNVSDTNRKYIFNGTICFRRSKKNAKPLEHRHGKTQYILDDASKSDQTSQ